MKLLAKIKAMPQVAEVWEEQDNRDLDERRRTDWWAKLSPGWAWAGCHGLHEPTLTELWRRIKDCEPCSCEQCGGER